MASGQLPHVPPQPSDPQFLPAQFGTHIDSPVSRGIAFLKESNSARVLVGIKYENGPILLIV
jgi:hypothetical protein